MCVWCKICLAPNMWLRCSVGSSAQLVSWRHGFKPHRSLEFFFSGFIFYNFFKLQFTCKDQFVTYHPQVIYDLFHIIYFVIKSKSRNDHFCLKLGAAPCPSSDFSVTNVGARYRIYSIKRPTLNKRPLQISAHSVGRKS